MMKRFRSNSITNHYARAPDPLLSKDRKRSRSIQQIQVFTDHNIVQGINQRRYWSNTWPQIQNCICVCNLCIIIMYKCVANKGVVMRFKSTCIRLFILMLVYHDCNMLCKRTSWYMHLRICTYEVCVSVWCVRSVFITVKCIVFLLPVFLWVMLRACV